jgi:hypothetical protein
MVIFKLISGLSKLEVVRSGLVISEMEARYPKSETRVGYVNHFQVRISG